MKKVLTKSALVVAALSTFIALTVMKTEKAYSDDHLVYGVLNNLPMGDPGEIQRKDFFVSIGTKQGVKKGTLLEVSRKTVTHDLINGKAFQDISFPIAVLKVIFADEEVAVARLDKMLPNATTPVLQVPGVVVGDLVEINH